MPTALCDQGMTTPQPEATYSLWLAARRRPPYHLYRQSCTNFCMMFDRSLLGALLEPLRLEVFAVGGSPCPAPAKLPGLGCTQSGARAAAASCKFVLLVWVDCCFHFFAQWCGHAHRDPGTFTSNTLALTPHMQPGCRLHTCCRCRAACPNASPMPSLKMNTGSSIVRPFASHSG